ncbi:cryptochrome/photolyase family protein [Halioglobus maricola]|uniref:Cryptochrome/photolyase family protein n=1 Tax=Halioglobus maricola TaxID=2601894 RepID=A0A5P9NMQ2_9GAMM|nr:cryptochrome/photolyase family protein [Halioglobus maricola]QFU76775.1 cryptochrome/photolyase family protein [Halioglobus maricola]
MNPPELILVLGDQLTAGKGALKDARPGIDTVVMAEVAEEASYVRHNRHKIVFIFSAMRHFRDELQNAGFEVIYYPYEAGKTSLLDAVHSALQECPAERVRCCKPGEYRLLEAMSEWHLAVPVELVEDDRFLASGDDFADWAKGRKQLRMEYFYRTMRRKYEILIDAQGKPEGENWNYDKQNRKGWRGKDTIPVRPTIEVDNITAEVIALVTEHFPDHPGDLDQFYLGVTAAQAQSQLLWFIDQGLPKFGEYQDAMAEESPWLYHALISAYINTGLLDPLEVCRAVERAWREERCSLAAAEGFIRQILGWREYVRGIYWMTAPSYADRNALDAHRPLPEWFWTGATDMRCLEKALRQSLDLGYGHHIQRLMIIGNFALLAGLQVQQVCEWYLAVYVDAFEWVELPNTLGMALYADGGLMASKPYAASGKYIQRQGDHCASCRYQPAKMTGPGACPYNSLYWHFINRHAEKLGDNPRLGLALNNWRRKDRDDQLAILTWADTELERLVPPVSV